MRKFISLLMMALFTLSLNARTVEPNQLVLEKSGKKSLPELSMRPTPKANVRSGIMSRVAAPAQTPARVAADATDVYYLRGGFNGWGTTTMTPDGNGGYTVTLASLSGSFKIDHYGDWSDNWGASVPETPVEVGEYYTALAQGGANLHFSNEQAIYEDVTVIFDPSVPALQVFGTLAGQTEITSWTVCGSQAIFGSEFDQTNTAYDMTQLPDGSWVLDLSNVHLDAGVAYYYKATANHTWGVSEVPAGDYWFMVELSGTYNLTFSMDANHTQLTCVPTLLSADTPTTVTDFSGSISVSNITTNSVDLSIVPADATQAYYWDIITKSTYDGILAGNYSSMGITTIAEYVDYIILYYLNSYENLTYEDLIDRGVHSSTLSGLSVATDYYLFAIAIDVNNGYSAYGTPTLRTFTTADVVESNNVISITFDSITSTVNITTTNNDPYFLWVETTAAYESYQSDYSDLSLHTEVEEWIDALDNQNLTSYSVYQGDLSFTLDEFFQMWYSRDAEYGSYIAFAVPYSGAIVGSLAHAIFNYPNPSAPVVPDLYYLRGGFNGWGTTAMTPNGNGGYSVTLDSLSGYFKIDHYGDWTENWGGSNPVIEGEIYSYLEPGGDNLCFSNAAKYNDVTVTFYPDVPALLVIGTPAGQVEYTSWTVCGSAEIFGTDDDPTNTANDMTAQADGSWILALDGVHLEAGVEYLYKATANHTWGVFEVPGSLSHHVFSVDTTGTYNLTFVLPAHLNYMLHTATRVQNTPDNPQNATVIWQGNHAAGGWASGFQDLSWGAFDWSIVTVGTILRVHYTIDPNAEYDAMIRIANGSWNGLPSTIAMGVYDGDILVTESGYVDVVLTEEDLYELVYNGGLVVCGSWFILTRVELLTEPQDETTKVYAYGGFEDPYSSTFVELTMVDTDIYRGTVTVNEMYGIGNFWISTTNNENKFWSNRGYRFSPANSKNLSHTTEPVRIYNDMHYIYSMTLNPGASYELTVNMATQQIAVNAVEDIAWSPLDADALKQDLDSVAAQQYRSAAYYRERIADFETVAAKYQARIDSLVLVLDAVVSDYTDWYEQDSLTLQNFPEWHLLLLKNEFYLVYDAALDEECGELVYTLDTHNPATVTYNKYGYYAGAEITIHAHAGEWTWFTLPFGMEMADIQAPDNANWVIRTYDGWNRAYGYSNTWQTLSKRDGWLSSGVGYILHCDPKHGQTGDAFDFVFRSSYNVYVDSYYTWIGDKGDVTCDEEDKSWNLIGNPYADSLYLPAMYQRHDIFAPVTVWNGNGYDAYTADDEYWLAPLQAFFVQKAEEADSQVQMDMTMLSNYVAPEAAAIQVREMADDRQVMNFTLNGNGYTDRARVVYNESAQVAYERTCDAAKFMSDGVAQLYVVENGRRLAIDERPAEDGTATLGISVAQNGQYTLALTSAIDDNLMLTDNETGVTTNLALMPYTFQATAGENEGRFTISIQPVATGIDNIQAGAAAYIYTIDGKFVGNDLRSLSAGSYIIRCGESVQKFIKK